MRIERVTEGMGKSVYDLFWDELVESCETPVEHQGPISRVLIQGVVSLIDCGLYSVLNSIRSEFDDGI